MAGRSYKINEMDGRTDTHHQPLVLALIDLTASKIAAGKNLKKGDPPWRGYRTRSLNRVNKAQIWLPLERRDAFLLEFWRWREDDSS